MEIKCHMRGLLLSNTLGVDGCELLNLAEGCGVEGYGLVPSPHFVVDSDGRVRLHWFVCGMDFRVQLDRLTIWVWESLSSIALIRPFLTELKRHDSTTTGPWYFKKMVGLVVFKACIPKPNWLNLEGVTELHILLTSP